MILWGWAEHTVEFDIEERQFCECCGENRDFGMRLKYGHGHFYHLFGWVRHQQYQLVCPVCSHGWLLNRDSARGLIGRDPIPFHQRHGGWVMLALATIIGIAAYVHHQSA